MPTVTYDGRSFMLDGRRIWLVAGSIPIGRISRDSWADRIHSAKQAGLNTIETPVFWNRHEPRQSKLDFTGDNDLRHFVKLVQAAGMYCVLRVGPFVGMGCDMGGLPAWLHDLNTAKLRTANNVYLEACSKFLTAAVEQVRDLQVTSPGRGGPVVAVQVESGWTCGDDTLAHHYLGELNRYVREAGLSVPLLNSNNLWQTVEGQIDGWRASGEEDVLATMRQLSCVRADQPRVVVSFSTGEPADWTSEPPASPEPWALQRRLAESLAGGGQFNLDPFCGGTNFGFWGGRLPVGQSQFATATSDGDAPIGESGARGRSWNMVRRIATFASRFGRVFAGFDPGYQPITLHPGTGKPPAGAKKSDHTPSSGEGHVIVHAMGQQGAVVFVFGDAPVEPGRSPATLLLPEGTTLPVSLGTQAVAWCLFDTNLNTRAHLDFTNLNALAMVGKVFVCFGPARSMGIVSINGSVVETVVPASGSAPSVLEHEGVQLLVLNEEQVDTAYLTDDAVYLGVLGIAADARPIVAADAKSYMHVAVDGVMSTRPANTAKAVSIALAAGSTGDRAPLSEWMIASAEDYASGSSPRYASIAGPAELSTLGAPFGYGWYRLGIRPAATGKAHVMAPFASDRLHFFADGDPVGILGVGPGATSELSVPFRKGQHNLVVMADNMGRFAGGAHIGEGKGLFGHLFEVESIKPGKPKLVEGEPIDVLGFRSPLLEVRPGDATEPARVTWMLNHRKKSPVIVQIGEIPVRGLLLLDQKPVAYVDAAGPGMIVLEPERFTKSTTALQIAVIGDGDTVTPELLEEIGEKVTFHDAVTNLTAKAEWSFAKWESPAATAFKAPKASRAHTPAWWRASFKPAKTPSPLYFDAAGLTKGQLYINGRHLCRYFVAAPGGKALPGQSRYFIPAAWLRAGENEVMVFDEHGASPAKCKMTYNHAATPLVAAVQV